MTLVEKHIVKKTNPIFSKLDALSFLSKNLYNSGLYLIRQRFTETRKYINYNAVDKIFNSSKQPDYIALPAKVSQQILRVLDQNFRSFFAHLKVKKDNERVRIPKYLDKIKGRFPVIYTRQAIKKGFVLSGTDIKIPSKVDLSIVQQVRIVHHGTHIVIEVIYTKSCYPVVDNGRIAAIDLGLNNLATITDGEHQSIIINGKPIKSINQYYNKIAARKKSNGVKYESLRIWRKNKIEDYLHKASRYIVNHLVSHDITTLVIGHNKNWKQEINIGKKNNQNFVMVPFAKFIHMLEYKSRLLGITVIVNEESYTSKCSFLDDEEPRKHDAYLGSRKYRGLFISSDGTKINADVNGSLNILRKVVGKFNYNSIAVCSTPVMVKSFY